MTYRYDHAATEIERDPQRFRVNLVCHCNNDIAFGYGPTEEVAREVAYRYFRREHPRQRPKEEIVERISADGSHYEEVSCRRTSCAPKAVGA